MFDWPISSPKMTRMFGFLPLAGDAAGCCCACATPSGLLVEIAVAAASVVPPSSMLRRLSAVLFTFDLSVRNPSTGYQNGVDWHLDWGASQFLTKTLQVGAVGYFFDQITPDHGCLDSSCPFESRTVGVGPQLGIIIPGMSTQTYLNFKAYWDIDTQNRASGASAWITLSFSPMPPSSSSQSSTAPPMVTKSPPHN